MPADADLQTRRGHQHCLHDKLLAFVVGKLHTRDGHQQGLHTIMLMLLLFPGAVVRQAVLPMGRTMSSASESARAVLTVIIRDLAS